METKNGGLALKLEAVPVGSDGWFTLTEPKSTSLNHRLEMWLI